MRKRKTQHDPLILRAGVLAIVSYIIYGTFRFGILDVSAPLQINCFADKWQTYNCLAFFNEAPLPVLLFFTFYIVTIVFLQQVMIKRPNARKKKKNG